MGYIRDGLEFKYSNRIEMNNEDRIKLYGLITDKYEVAPDEIEKEFGIIVGRQLNLLEMDMETDKDKEKKGNTHDRHIMSEEEYYRRYGHGRSSNVASFLMGSD